MGSEFEVDLESLDQIVAMLRALSGFIGDHLDEIDNRVAGLIGGDWESTAASAYESAHQEWIAGARRLVEGVRDIGEAADIARGRYAGAIDLNKRMLRGG